MATVAASPAQTGTPHGSNQKPPRSRMLRSIGRFLSGAGSKQRPKLATNDPAERAHGSGQHHQAPLGSDEPRRSAESRSSRSSPASSEGRSEVDDDDDGDDIDTHDDDDERHIRDGHSTTAATSTRAVRRFPRNDSVSRYSAISGADTDASLYAVASTRPGSSVHTVDSSHASSIAPSAHASTHKSYASTKPTTLLSVDSLGGGANRIAVVPGTGGTGSQYAHTGTSTGLSFSSALPSTPPQASPLTNATAGPSGESRNRHQRGTSASSSSSFNSYDPTAYTAGLLPAGAPDSPSSAQSDGDRHGVNVPNYSHPHPRNNPHPAYPPQDNASVLTLASSSFAPSIIGSTGGESKTRTNSWGGGGLGGLHAWSSKQQARSLGGGARSLVAADSLSVGGPSGASGVVADEDASVRALPGSRRNSEESLGGRSTWSAAPKSAASPSIRSRPLDDELAATTGGTSIGGVGGGGNGAVPPSGSGQAASLSPSRRERRTSLRTVETAPSIRSTNGDGREFDAASSATEDEPTTPSGTTAFGSAAPHENNDLLTADRPERAVTPDVSSRAGSAAASFTTALEPSDASGNEDETSMGSRGVGELAPPIPDIGETDLALQAATLRQ